jgi:hypothetical protein
MMVRPWKLRMCVGGTTVTTSSFSTYLYFASSSAASISLLVDETDHRPCCAYGWVVSCDLVAWLSNTVWFMVTSRMSSWLQKIAISGRRMTRRQRWQWSTSRGDGDDRLVMAMIQLDSNGLRWVVVAVGGIHPEVVAPKVKLQWVSRWGLRARQWTVDSGAFQTGINKIK